MLVYERRLKTPIKMVVPHEKAKQIIISKNKEPTILDCENTALTRVVTDQIYLDPIKDEYFEYVDFHNVKSVVPQPLYNEVWEDNSNFLFEQQIYSLEFFKFVQDILKDSFALLPSLPKETATLTEVSMTQVAAKVVFEVLSHAYYNMAIKPLTEQLVQLFSQSHSAAQELLSYMMQDNFRKPMIVLQKCPAKEVRTAVANLITEVVLVLLAKEGDNFMEYELFEYEKQQVIRYKSKLGNLLFVLCNGITPELSQHWLIFEQYFELLFDTAKRGGDKILLFYNANQLLLRLIDLYLGVKSPLYEKGQKRYLMGSKTKLPKFEPLIRLVCTLALRANLSTFQPDVYKIYDLPKPLYELKADEKECLQSFAFIEKTIIEGYATQEFADLFTIFCYENERYSKKLSKLLLCAINEDPTRDMTPHFIMLTKVLTIKDSIQKKRLEWLLGIGSLQKVFVQAITSVKPHEQIKFGLELIDSIRDNVMQYDSVLTYNMPFDSLLSLLWRHRKRFDLNPICCLLNLVLESPIVFDYVLKLPPPTYYYAKYTDWIRPLVMNYPTSYRTILGIGFNSPRRKNGEPFEDALKLLNEFDKRCEQEFSKNPAYKTHPKGVLFANPPPYLIGKPIEEKILIQETKENITIVVSELITETYRSLPTGKENIGIPLRYLEKMKGENNAAVSPSKNIISIEKELTEKYRQDPEEAKLLTKDESTAKMMSDIKAVTQTYFLEDIKPMSIEASVLKIEVINHDTRPFKAKVDLIEDPKVEGKENVINFVLPSSTLNAIVEGQKRVVVMMLMKLNLGRAWGNFHISWRTAPFKARHQRVDKEIDSPNTDQYTYYPMEEGIRPYGPEYDPSLREYYSANLCPFCRAENRYGEARCKKCNAMIDSL